MQLKPLRLRQEYLQELTTIQFYAKERRG